MSDTATSQWFPVRVRMSGYLGVGARDLTVDLDRDLVVLDGPNGSGKSTVTSAVEWALFGSLDLGVQVVDDFKGAGHDVHRVYIHRGCDAAKVEVECERDGSTLVWRRRRSRATPHPASDEVSCTVDGEAVAADPLELFGLTHELYSRVVAPRQADLLGVVSAEGKERNKALDRLFGIEQLNVLTSGLNQAQSECRGAVDNLDSRAREVLGRLQSRVADRFTRRSEARGRAVEAGAAADLLSVEGSMRAAQRLADELDIKTEPSLADIVGLRALVDRLQTAATEQWTAAGPQNRLSRLQGAKGALDAAIPDWDLALEGRQTARDGMVATEAAVGAQTELEEKAARMVGQSDDVEQQLTEASSRVAVLARADDWLKSNVAGSGELDCPVCERSIAGDELRRIVDAALAALGGKDGSVAALLARKQALADQSETISTGLRRVQAAETKVDAAEAAVVTVRKTLVAALEKATSFWRGVVPDAGEKAAQSRCEEALAAVGGLGDAACSTFDDDILDREAREALRAVTECWRTTGDEVTRAQERILDVQRSVAALDKAVTFFQADSELAELDPLVQGDEFAELGGCVESLEGWLETLKVVRDAAAEVAKSEAEGRVAVVAPKLDEWFQSLSAHDALCGAEVVVETKRPGGRVSNTYRIRACWDDGGLAAPGPELSGGYQTVLAVAALCALTDAEASGRRLALLVLDEPTQSLDPDLTQRLGEALGSGLAGLRTVVTTTDRTLVSALRKGAGPLRSKVVPFERWTSAAGTRVADKEGS